MQHALAEARAAGQRGEVPIGAVLVDTESGDIIVGAGNGPVAFNDPTAHAEILVLRRAAQKQKTYRLSGVTLYVTLEPCTMCAAAISFARVSRLVYGASDAKGGGIEHGARFFEQPTCHHRPEIVRGILAEESARLLSEFFRERRG